MRREMGKRRRLGERFMEPIDRLSLVAIASVLGKASAAAQALDEADKHDGQVNFYRTERGIVLEKMPKPTADA